jgi:hypothetical protein
VHRDGNQQCGHEEQSVEKEGYKVAHYSGPRKVTAKPLTLWGFSLDGDFADAFSGSAPRGRTTSATGSPAPARRRGDTVLVDEHQGRDQLTLRVQQVHLRRGRDHVRQQVADPRPEFVDGLDQTFAVAAHFFFS